ncbi:MAG: DUF4157 domain-containing protein [Rhodospirillales bacterium]|nr:MAG: DUF4157 domain-containing protein [Rhodospirillales bacterium]
MAPPPKTVPMPMVGRIGVLHRKCAACEEEGTLQRRRGPGRDPDTVPAIVHDVLRAPGQPLDADTRAFFEPRFGHDFSRVRVHTDARAAGSARAVNARAYTVGSDIVFTQGAFAPGSRAGRQLLAHELAHVVQQAPLTIKRNSVQHIGSASDPTEVEADLAAKRVLIGERASIDSSARSTPVLQRQEGDGGQLILENGQPTGEQLSAPPSQMTEVGPHGGTNDRVQRMVFSCTDMRLRLETASTHYLYRLDECEMMLGSYQAEVSVSGNDFHLNILNMPETEAFNFRYRVEHGQENPSTLLGDQSTVLVEVVEHVPPARPAEPRPERPQAPECMIRLADRELVPADSVSRALFDPLSFNQTIWSNSIPLGQFGWVDVGATASGRLTGHFSGSYGPGRLTDICLTHMVEAIPSSAPIEHPLLGRGSQADVTTYVIGGRARFHLPARAVIRIVGRGELVISGDYLSVIEVAAAEGALDARGEAALAGTINGAVEIRAQATASRATLEHPSALVPLALVLERSSIDSVDLATEIGLRGRAGLMVRVDLSAGFRLLGVSLWSQTWPLIAFDAGVGWSGGIKYSPNPGVHWNFGSLDVDEGDADEYEENEDHADVALDDIIEAILDDARANVSSPDGLSEDTALPFDWYKPRELYAPTVNIPNADDPNEIDQFDGPTLVRYQYRGRTMYEEIGVADWPSVRRRFEFFPYDSRSEPEKNRFNRLIDRLGFDRTGFDADHVWDIKLRGLDYDRFDNLWPASNQEQRLAGVRHNNQIQNYRATLDNIEGRWFEIVRVRHPA